MNNVLKDVNNIQNLYNKHINPSLTKLTSFAGFGTEHTGQGCYITDSEGKTFLDLLGSYGVFALGHKHPKVVEAVKNQMDILPLSTKVFFNETQALLAEKLSALTNHKLPYSFFSNSGTEAVEAALKFAKISTGRSKFISTKGGYHGKTIGSLSVTGRDKFRKPFEPLLSGSCFVPFGCLETLKKEMDQNVAAIIIEVIQGEGGIHTVPKGYLKQVRQLCDEHGALLILDEVQTGIGRTGTFFAYEQEDVEPHIITLAKALGGGIMPIGVTMGTAEIWDKVFGENPLIHTSTFGGNPLACTAALTTLQVIEEENLLEAVTEKGNHFLNGLNKIVQKFPKLLKEARGRGLMLGIEFIIPDSAELTIVQMLKRNILAAYTLNNPFVIRIEPAYIITEEEINRALKAIEESVQDVEDVLKSIDVL